MGIDKRNTKKSEKIKKPFFKEKRLSKALYLVTSTKLSFI